MDITLLQTIIENNYKLPEGHAVTEITPQLISNLGSTDSDLRESSYMVLASLICSETDMNYQPEELREIGTQMACNLKLGIDEHNSDSVFLRSFSLLILDKIIAVDNKKHYLTELEVRNWLEQSVTYFLAERDLRGYIPGKGWAHAVAHAGDLFCVISRNRFLDADALKLILNAIADKVTAPVKSAYLYEEDERLAKAVISVLLRNLLDMAFWKSWLNQFINPPSGIKWSDAFSDQANVNARHNTITFLRSLYFQLLLSAAKFHKGHTNETSRMRDELMSSIIETLKAIDDWVYTEEGTTS